MRNSVRDKLSPRKGRGIKRNQVGQEIVPRDLEALEVAYKLATKAAEDCPRSIGFFPGAYTDSAMIRFAMDLDVPGSDGTAPGLWCKRICREFFESVDQHPFGVRRLKRAVWLDIIRQQLSVWAWDCPEKHYIGEVDPNWVRTCKVAAAKMLSQKKVFSVVLDEERAVILREDYPEYTRPYNLF